LEVLVCDVRAGSDDADVTVSDELGGVAERLAAHDGLLISGTVVLEAVLVAVVLMVVSIIGGCGGGGARVIG
jgi:hypothetical protein